MSTRWPALAIAVLLAACRGRSLSAPTADWNPRPGARAEAAALLLLDKDGMAKVTCLPARAGPRQLLRGIALRRILDVSWNGGPLLAGSAAAAGDKEQSSIGELVLLGPRGEPRRLAKDVQSARFSPDAGALAYEVAQPSTAGVSLPTTYVLELATDKVTRLSGFADPLWEADGKHLRATQLRAAGEAGRTSEAHWISLRARWDRESGASTIDGRGSAQIPAPVGEAVAWSEEQRSAMAPSQCAVFLRRQGGVKHSIVGRFCAGIADDRSVRWSPDGQWLAFPHPGPASSRHTPGAFFVDVVGIQGGRYPALSELRAQARPAELALAVSPGAVSFDWSPSGRFLALSDGADDLRLYDFEAHGTSALGKGQGPMWSPGGGYLLILASGQAVVLSGVTSGAGIVLGPARDARWLPAEAWRVECSPAQ